MRRMGTARATYVCIEMSHYPVNLILVINEVKGCLGRRDWF